MALVSSYCCLAVAAHGSTRILSRAAFVGVVPTAATHQQQQQQHQSHRFLLSATTATRTRYCSSSVRRVLASTLVSISDSFCGGNIERVGNNNDCSERSVRLAIKPDVYTELEDKHHCQYFCFRSTVSQVQDISYSIDNAVSVSFPNAWKGSTIFWR
jgi:Cytosolic carboxypeptidase N-terminal domain